MLLNSRKKTRSSLTISNAGRLATYGLTPDRGPSESFSSIAAVGFALTAYPIGVERGYITREDAVQRTLTTLEFFRDAPQGDAPTGMAGHHEFYYHFLDFKTGRRYRTNELSTIDTALLDLYAKYGFLDCFNPSFTFTEIKLGHGRLVAGKGWFDDEYLGIDQGPILTMIENWRTGFVWKIMRRNPHIKRGLKRAGFSGGWLE